MEKVDIIAGTAGFVFSDKAISLPAAGGRIGLRPVIADDREFLFYVYASTRSEEMKLVDWDEGKKDEFLRMQFAAQDMYYRDNYTSASFLVVHFNDCPCGRLYIDRWDSEIRIMDIALLPDFRNRGIGSVLLKQIIEEGRRLALPVTIHVEQFNPALRLYQRLGFVPAGENGIYLLMRWSAGQPACKVGLEAISHA